jgi:hypothetical protein
MTMLWNFTFFLLKVNFFKYFCKKEAAGVRDVCFRESRRFKPHHTAAKFVSEPGSMSGRSVVF